MRIGLLIYGSLETLSGGYLYDRILVEYLQKQGHAVTVVSLPWRNYGQHLRDNFSAEFSARLRQLAVDVLVQDELNHPSVVWLNRQLQGRVPYKLVSLVHLVRYYEPRARWDVWLSRYIEQTYFRRVDGFIFNSEHTRQLVTASLRQPVPSIVAPPGSDRVGGLDVGAVQARSRQGKHLRILFLGNVTARKALSTVLKALQSLPAQQFELRIVGRLDIEPGYVAHCRQLAAGLAPAVNWLGAQYGADLQAHLSWAHVMALPSQYEGYGMAYAEALQHGQPCIASQDGAAGEVIEHGKCGWLIAPQDASALASHLLAWQKDRTLLAHMSTAALAHAQQLPTWQATCQRIEQFLLSVT
jgi:glycosyltransferase involved in cell wall biosynthesis